MSISTFGALIHTDPEQARKRIVDAFIAARGERTKAAAALGLKTPRTLYRWIERLDLWPEVDRLIEAHGFDRLPAPPRTRTRVSAALTKARGNLNRAARALGLTPEALRVRIKQLNLDAEPVKSASSNGGRA